MKYYALYINKIMSTYESRFRGGILLLGFLLCPTAQRKWIFHECKLEMRMRERFGTSKTINALMMVFAFE